MSVSSTKKPLEQISLHNYANRNFLTFPWFLEFLWNSLTFLWLEKCKSIFQVFPDFHMEWESWFWQYESKMMKILPGVTWIQQLFIGCPVRLPICPDLVSHNKFQELIECNMFGWICIFEPLKYILDNFNPNSVVVFPVSHPFHVQKCWCQSAKRIPD